jgi:hypothetical protein
MSMLAGLVLTSAGTALAHGRMVDPPARTNGGPQENGQFCQGDPSCLCGQSDPGAGPVVAAYVEGETIQVSVDITIAHGSGDFFHFQLCPTSDISLECFELGEIAAFVNDGATGLHTYTLDLPSGVTCDGCVLRWKWDYGFVGCADVAIEPSLVGVPDGPGVSWGSIKGVLLR